MFVGSLASNDKKDPDCQLKYYPFFFFSSISACSKQLLHWKQLHRSCRISPSTNVDWPERPWRAVSTAIRRPTHPGGGWRYPISSTFASFEPERPGEVRSPPDQQAAPQSTQWGSISPHCLLLQCPHSCHSQRWCSDEIIHRGPRPCSTTEK